jgi:predicted MFS family arabinose efflux permease
MQTVAAGWLIFDLTHSAAAVGVLTACSRGPAIFLSTYGGTLADRFDRRRLTVVLYAAQAIPARLLAFRAWMETPSPLEIYGLTLVIGIAGALASAELQETVTGTVPAGLASMRSAVSSVRSHPVLRTIFPVLPLFSLMVGPVQELAPALAHRYGGGAHLLGFLLSALAVGGIIAVPIRSLLQRRKVAMADAFGASMVLVAVCLFLLAASPNFAIAALAMVLCGIGWDVIYIFALTGVQLDDKRMSGLMTGLFFTVTVGGLTLGALLVANAFDLVGMGFGLSALR